MSGSEFVEMYVGVGA